MPPLESFDSVVNSLGPLIAQWAPNNEDPIPSRPEVGTTRGICVKPSGPDSRKSSASTEGSLAGSSILSNAQDLVFRRAYFNNLHVQVVINQGTDPANSFDPGSESRYRSLTSEPESQEQPVSTLPTNVPLQIQNLAPRNKDNGVPFSEQPAMHHQERTLQERENTLAYRENLVQRKEHELSLQEQELREMRARTFSMLRAVVKKWGSMGNSQQPSTTTMESGDSVLVGETLQNLFGVENAKGFHTHSNFKFFTNTDQDIPGNLTDLGPHFVPYYNGLSKKLIERLEISLKISIGGVINTLIAQKKKEALTFKIVRANLAQLPFLQCPSDPVSLHRFIECKKTPQVARLFLDSQWILKIIESDQPGAVFDKELTLPAGSSKKAKIAISPPLQDTLGRSSSEDTFIDLAVLSFPRNDIPWFKLSHLVLKTCILSKTRLASRKKVEVGLIIDYISQRFYVRQTVINSMKEELKGRAMIFTESLFI